MFTRKDYMENKCTHQEYYSQFVNSIVKDTVRNLISVEKIKNSNDKHFHDIPLAQWDRISNWLQEYIARINLNLNGIATYSIAEGVCVAKEAARQIKEEK